jgi:hypothetical protein
VGQSGEVRLGSGWPARRFVSGTEWAERCHFRQPLATSMTYIRPPRPWTRCRTSALVWNFETSTRGRARARHGVLQERMYVTWDDEEWWHDWVEPSERRKDRPRCGAKNRAGWSCLMRVEPGKARCRFHGGLSTGPKTEAGRARIAHAQRRRWQAYREQRAKSSAAVGEERPHPLLEKTRSPRAPSS